MRAMVLIGAALMLIGCTHTVKGAKMKISIKRAPACKVVVDLDGKRVFVGTATKPCAKAN
jgi:hypothetical protein